ncbi:MAG: hypothetical protein JKY54_18515 [Flavobacteriales bacterium]|nr:hypothetical protein [Flavobacteriales bacterium]
MKGLLTYIGIISALMYSTSSLAQGDPNDEKVLLEFNLHYNKAMEAMDGYLYDVAMDQLQTAKQIAFEHNFEKPTSQPLSPGENYSERPAILMRD